MSVFGMLRRYVNWLSTGSTEDGVYAMKPRQGDNKFAVIERNQQSLIRAITHCPPMLSG